MAIYITTPLTEGVVAQLRAGDEVAISGVLYTARDAAHKRLVSLIKSGSQLPFDLAGQVIYYVGPTPARPGLPTGSAGPTTSGRMDPYTPLLIEHGLKGMIGKGVRSLEVREVMRKYKAVYFGATGGAGALLAKRIKSSELVAYEDLGPEAIWRFVVEDFPAIVVDDIYGDDLYEQGMERYRIV